MCHSFRLQRVCWSGHLTMQNTREESSELLRVIFHNPPPYWVSTEAPPSTISLWSPHRPFTAFGQAALSHTNSRTYDPLPSFLLFFRKRNDNFKGCSIAFHILSPPNTLTGLLCHKQCLLHWFFIQLATCNKNTQPRTHISYQYHCSNCQNFFPPPPPFCLY